MPTPPEHAFKEKSTKSLILLSLRSIYNRTFQCETPCTYRDHCANLVDDSYTLALNSFFSVDHRRPGFNNRIRRLQQNNRRSGLYEDKGPHLFKRPGPPYPGPNPRAPNKPLDPTIIHPSNQYPIYKRPGESPNNICLYLVSE